MPSFIFWSASKPISQLAIWPEKKIIRRPAATAQCYMLEAVYLDAPARFEDPDFL
jgi:hypothetical protein